MLADFLALPMEIVPSRDLIPEAASPEHPLPSRCLRFTVCGVSFRPNSGLQPTNHWSRR